ncbi:hypothetical protein CgunFtcFv8_025586 [Champsocephalus gunnari]|uniref:Uncharacterized protein n=1 Tax=Champsocephalus gunnari TaxID=52237 RepID=A0AAN8CBK0_CHAGU|nr:hypothetical protein CgunFtcFv8_025586 [Champsocephalus gunnari]
MNSKSSFGPHPPQSPLIIGETADPDLKQPGSKHGRVIKHQNKDPLQGRVPTPCPPDIVPSQQRSELTTKHSLLPTISKGVQHTHNQTQFRPHPPQSPLIRGKTADPDLKQPGSKHGRVIKHQNKDPLQGRVPTPCPPDIVPSQQRSELTTKHSLLPTISKGVQRTHNQTQFRPHPPQSPLIRGKTADPDLKQPGSKHGRVIKHQNKDPLQGRVPTPCPPDIVPSQQRSELTTKHSLLPTISKGVQRTHNQTQFRPHPPQSPLIRGETADPDLKQPGSKHGRVIKHQNKDPLQGRVPTPCPPDIVPSQQRSELTTKHSLLPTISKGVQRTHNQTQFRPHPPQSPLISGETADPDLKQPGSKYGRVIKHQNKYPLKGRVLLTPCPPDIVPSQQRSELTTMHSLLQTIPKGVQRTHNQTQFRPHPPQSPLIRGGSSLKTSYSQTPRLRLPPLTEKVQLTTRKQ